MTNKNLSILSSIIFFLSILFLSTPITLDFDSWFHIKSGEVISQQGIIHHDVFAFTTKNREWFPYEWLFQISIYQVQNLFGLTGVKIATAIISTLLVFLIFQILRKIFDLSVYTSITLSLIFFASTQEFYTSRPQILAYLFFLTNLYLIFLYYFRSKNLLFLTLPITLAWANMHGSIFLDIALFAGFATLCIINYLLFKEKSWLHKFKILALYTPLTFGLTILPPLGFIQYRLLGTFFQNREMISRFISEWAPIQVAPFSFYLFSGSAAIILGAFIIINYKNNRLKQSLWALILIPFIFSVYLASRNIFYGYVVLILILGSFLPQLKSLKLNKPILILLVFVVLGFHAWMINDKRKSQFFDNLYTPAAATKFIKDQHLQGNMFNEYGFGGYLLYHLYPEQQVYFDGRTDLYLCCEMPDTLELAYKKNLSDSEYKKILDALWDKNQISFVLMRTEKHVLLRKIGKILQEDPAWSLVYWDDAAVIFVRKDGKNNDLIDKLGTIAATPYNKDPFRPETTDQAFEEYQRMITVADSSKSRNTIGFIYLQKGEFDKAKIEFQTAIQINPFNESPYMNLAELSVKDRDAYQAVKLYEKAKELAPDRGMIYIRLGQLILDTYGDKERAMNTWKDGLKNTIDADAKVTLQKLINSLSEAK